MKRYFYLLFLFTQFFLLETIAAQETKKPNILFIMADDHTSQAWGIYGGILEDYVHTTNIKRLAKEGCVLDNCLVSNSICTPSRATILSGQYSHFNGVKTLHDSFSPAHENIAKVLHNGGYQTAIIGKWHLKKEPTGFDYYCVLPGQGRYWNPILKTKENWEDGNKGGKPYPGYSTDIITDKTIDWIKDRDKTKPFLMMCHFKATHEPYDYPERFKNLYKDEDIPFPASLFDQGAETTGRSFTGQSLDNLQDRYVTATKDSTKRMGFMKYPDLPFSVDSLGVREARMKTYQKFIKDFMRCGVGIDDNIGRLLDYLDKAGLADNTIVIYTADQGYFLGEHGWFDKRLIYEESIHMPFVIRYPKEIPAGTRNKDIIENVDISALMADYAGIEYPKSMQGESFRNNLKGNTPVNWREYGYYRYWEHSKDRPAHFGIRGQRYKLAFYYGNGLSENNYGEEDKPKRYWDFFDLKEDPSELYNAYNDPRYRKIIQLMKKEIMVQRELVGDTDQENKEVREIIAAHWDD